MLCVIICCYNNHNIYYNIKTFLDNIGHEYELFIVNNNIEIQHELSIKYKNVFEGDNQIYEFTGIQKCLNYIDKKKYNCFILGTDALFNYPIFYLDFINKYTIDFSITNECCIGNIDSFGKTYKLENYNITYWLRTSFVIINALMFEKMNYQFITFKNIYDEGNIKVEQELINTLNNWLGADRYKYINSDIKKKTKLTCIFNEYCFTQRAVKYGKIYDFVTIYLYNFFLSTQTKNNMSLLINNITYENNNNLRKLLNMEPVEQLKQKNKFLL